MLRAIRQRGFTLIEMITVIGIIMILVAVAVPGYILVQRRAKERAARTDMQSLSIALQHFQATFGHFPPSGRPFASLGVMHPVFSEVKADGTIVPIIYGDPRILPAFLKELPEATAYNARGQAVSRGGAPMMRFEASRLVPIDYFGRGAEDILRTLPRIAFGPTLGYDDPADVNETWLRLYPTLGAAQSGGTNYLMAPNLMYIDPFQVPYDYTRSGTGYELRSFGTDRRRGTSDDIVISF